MEQNFDVFSNSLLEEAIRFYEKSFDEKSPDGKCAYLHASLLLGMCSLEAFVNSVAEEISIRDDLPIIEKALLLERDVRFDKGTFVIQNNLKIYRLIDRVDYLIRKFSGKKYDLNAVWRTQILNSINIRNDLVHPKKYVHVTDRHVKNTLLAVIESINQIYLAVYKVKLPRYKSGLYTKMQF